MFVCVWFVLCLIFCGGGMFILIACMCVCLSIVGLC